MNAQRRLAAAIGIAAIIGITTAQGSADPTFAEDVAPILYRNCTVCHHPGGMGPFSLIDYDSAKQFLPEMRDRVSKGEMPPWHAAGPRGEFLNDRRLTDDERQTIVRWIDAGAKAGDLTRLPPRPTYGDGWATGTPDLVVGLPEEFVVPAQGTVEYQYFEAAVPITEDKWVSSIEIRPGAREVVHHVLVYARPPADAPRTASPLVRNPALATPQRPKRTDAHAPPSSIGSLIATATPGNETMVFPKGTALRLRAGSTVVFQMHYTAHGHEMKDRTVVGFHFAPQAPEEEIFASAFFNGQMVVPAGAKDVAVPAEIGTKEAIRVWGLMPHTHLRGTRWRYTVDRPNSTSSVILDVPRYDFNWQTYYLFARPVEVPAGGMIRSIAWYDNSAANKNNPDPTIEVRWGDQTWEEMQYTGFLYSIARRP